MYAYTIYIRRTEVRTKGGFPTYAAAIAAAEADLDPKTETAQVFRVLR